MNKLSLFYITVEHIATGLRYTVPVLAESLEDARTAAADWPYINDGYKLV
jgi:hypothetical protein